MSRLAAAAAFACTIVLISEPSEARMRLRFSAPAPRPTLSTTKRVAPPAAASATRGNVGLFIPVGSRPAAAAPAPQQAANDPTKGPLLYDPSLGSDDAKPPAAATGDKAGQPPKELAAAPTTDCAVKEPAPAKEATKEKEITAAAEAAKTEPARSRSAFLVPVVNRHPRAPLPTSRAATVCYVQRDGTCAP